jgi:hypothetical protein
LRLCAFVVSISPVVYESVLDGELVAVEREPDGGRAPRQRAGGGIIICRGRGIMFTVTHARPLTMNALVAMAESMPEQPHEPVIIPQAARSYPGTTLGAQLVTA